VTWCCEYHVPACLTQVGKVLPRAQNDTSVAFRSKAITLPGQSVAADRAGAAVSSHNLTLKVLQRPACHRWINFWFLRQDDVNQSQMCPVVHMPPACCLLKYGLNGISNIDGLCFRADAKCRSC
jgi:hypothetical protein